MAVEVVWSDEARRTFEKNIQYLLEAWSQREVANFVQQSQFVINRIQEQPESCQPSAVSKSIRKARINKQINLYYKFSKSKKQISLLSFWNVKQNPDKLKY